MGWLLEEKIVREIIPQIFAKNAYDFLEKGIYFGKERMTGNKRLYLYVLQIVRIFYNQHVLLIIKEKEMQCM